MGPHELSPHDRPRDRRDVSRPSGEALRGAEDLEGLVEPTLALVDHPEVQEDRRSIGRGRGQQRVGPAQERGCPPQVAAIERVSSRDAEPCGRPEADLSTALVAGGDLGSQTRGLLEVVAEDLVELALRSQRTEGATLSRPLGSASPGSRG